MSAKKSSNDQVSRRDFLFITAATGGAAIGAGLIATPAAAAGKMPQKAVSYQSTPKGKQRCDNCSLWQPPGSCKLVQDPIDPAGWCVLYKAKA